MPRQYRKGEVITTLDRLYGVLTAGRWIMLREKPVHPRVVLCMTLQTVMVFLGRGLLSVAEKEVT